MVDLSSDRDVRVGRGRDPPPTACRIRSNVWLPGGPLVFVSGSRHRYHGPTVVLARIDEAWGPRTVEINIGPLKATSPQVTFSTNPFTEFQGEHHDARHQNCIDKS